MTCAATGRLGWDDPENAREYAAFVADHDWYDGLARGLVDRVDPVELRRADLVVDLCAGTGVVTRAVLPRLSSSARVLAVDRSETMLAQDISTFRDGRVGRVGRAAEDCGELAPNRCDIVFCSAALWETAVPTTIAGVARLLRPGGRFAFNLSPAAVRWGREYQASAVSTTLWERIESAVQRVLAIPAGRDHEWPAPPPWPLYRQALVSAGFRVDSAVVVEYPMTLSQMCRWLTIPVFRPHLPELTADQWRDVVACAAGELDPGQVMSAPWLVVLASRQLSNMESTSHSHQYVQD